MTTVEIIWRDDLGVIQRKIMLWRKPATNSDLADWMLNYLDLLTEGYRPPGFEHPPLPHCARVLHLGKVVAEWHPRFSVAGSSAESHVTAEERRRPGGIPANTPSCPDTGVAGGPNATGPGRVPIPDSDQIRRDPSNATRSDKPSSPRDEAPA